MPEQKMLARCENHALEALKCKINPETARILQQMIVC